MQMEAEEEKALFAYSSYYVQSPSSVTHPNGTDECRNPELLLLPYHSPPREESYPTQPVINVQTPILNNFSRCSSSRASTSSFDEEKKKIHGPAEKMITIYSINDHVVAAKNLGKINKNGDEEVEDYYDHEDEGSCLKYFAFSTYPSFLWVAIQLSWRFLLSLMAALLVFYIATKPPPPNVSVKMTGIKQFELPEGVDSSGVATNFFSCNISLSLLIENKSKVFALHTLSPVVQIYFGRVPFVLSQGPKLQVGSHESIPFKVYAGVTNKAMYGGGRNMRDMLSSERGLPLLITLTFTSYFRVVGSFIQPKFHHHTQCLFIVQNFYDKMRHTQAYNSTCMVTPFLSSAPGLQ